MRIFHTAIAVKNLNRSRQFYEDVFGLKPNREGERPELGMKFVMLEDKSGTGVELMEMTEQAEVENRWMDFNELGFKHLALVVDDIEDIITKAEAHGAKILWPVKKGVTVKRIAFIADPDGIPIELTEL